MGFLGGMMKVGLAKKVFDEARKPQNQQRVKDLIASARNKRSGGTTGTRRPR